MMHDWYLSVCVQLLIIISTVFTHEQMLVPFYCTQTTNILTHATEHCKAPPLFLPLKLRTLAHFLIFRTFLTTTENFSDSE